MNIRWMKVVLESKDAADWAYKGEGAANLVLAYSGSSPDFVGKVLRIQKVPLDGSESVRSASGLSTHERLLWRDVVDGGLSPAKEIIGQLYVDCVMRPRLGPKHVDAGVRVHVSREFLESVEKNVLCRRPAWRVDAAKVDTLCDSAVIISDHSIFSQGSHKGAPCISVEIKPKCGFLPFSRYVHEGHAIKRSITRFKMHQVLKLRQREISQLSEYDPLDLFSGSKDRIRKAIKALFTTPQNNFRVFLNGSLVFGGLGGGTNSTSFVMGEAFEDALKIFIQADDGLRTTRFLQLVAETVFSSRVLDGLLEVQKLDNCDIEGAIHAYYNIVSQPCMVCRELSEERVSHSHTYLHSISLDESLKIVKDYLISATAKDCGLMITFRPKKDGDSGSSYKDTYLESTDQFFDYKANFIDLDMKPLDKMEYYYELDKKIVSCYNQMMKREHEAEEAASVSF